ncbi:YwqG family protein [Hymenobacter yonginensis]|uniref:YwqG family protein n=1 Tax=Hymenobacter yonginensis TaxID=748197 RepID=A0ABY7PU49_9BACT|nr:YwqG family protein [Hymenobacter yonginensis]WBO86384.1 YwqG family protein [Hymenobacter yonginensis]
MTHPIIPDFLQPFRAELERHALESIKATARPRPTPGPPSAASKFRGLPLLPLSMAYPRQQNGTPLLLLAQINLAELPANTLLPAAGLLQFYIPAQDWYDMEEAQVRYIGPEHLGAEYQQDFSFLPANHDEESPINCEHDLTFEATLEYGGLDDERFALNFNGLNGYDFEETLPEKDKEAFSKLLSGAGHKIGGYAYFTQGDPHAYSKGAAEVQLLQIDIDEQIMFGDSGVAHFFITEEALKNREFDKAYFYWDCC